MAVVYFSGRWSSALEPGTDKNRVTSLGPSNFLQIIASIPSAKLPTKLVVGADAPEPVPLLGLQPMEPDLVLEPCDDRSGNGLWMWSFTRIQTKVSSSF